MKIKMRILLPSLVLVFASFVSHKMCESFHFVKGSYFEMEHYKDKKLESITKHTVKNVTTNGAKKEALVHTEIRNAKDVKEEELDVKFICEGSVIKFDLVGQLNKKVLNNPNFDAEIEESFMEIPRNLTVGQTLPDNVMKIKMKMKGSGDEVGKMIMTFGNRKVVGKEKVTTKAGTFDCFKLTTEIKQEMVMMGNSMPLPGTKMVDYYNNEAGTVKSETLNDKGEVTHYSVLTSIKKP